LKEIGKKGRKTERREEEKKTEKKD